MANETSSVKNNNNNNMQAQAEDTGKQSGGSRDTAPLKKFFLDALKDMLWAEKALVTGLQKLQKVAASEELADAFETHELQTNKHISRLEKVFDMLGEKAEAKKCKAMEGLLKEADEIVDATPEYSATRDAAIIIAAQKVEHYEIASYGGLVAIAHTLGYERVAHLLEKTLLEEEDTDYMLTEVAECHINFEAVQEDAHEKVTA